jgi:hypothetical protein
LVVDEAQNLTARAVEELRMLSNFQLGNHSLLQSFLVGQPEFREILQRPEMEQFRQRVSATCHIGPLDRDETEAYILHRLKCAGSTGFPEIEPQAFPEIHAASHGIPRRINSICDRLLLLGYMENRKHLTSADVDTVLRDFAGEGTTAGKTSDRALNGAAPGPLLSNGKRGSRLGVDLLLPLPVVDASSREAMLRSLSDTELHQVEGRLLRLEAGLMRLEEVGVRTLHTLQDLVNGADSRAVMTRAMTAAAREDVATGAVMCVVGARPNFIKIAPDPCCARSALAAAVGLHARAHRPALRRGDERAAVRLTSPALDPT